MIVIDVEIAKAIPPRRDEPRLPDIEYCEGWRDFKGMGIACVCTYDLLNGLSRTFLQDDLEWLDGYLAGVPTAGFNTRRFDLPLLAEHGVKIEGPHFDILECIWIALGLDPDKFVPKTHGGWSLDACMEGTMGLTKSGNGAMAPVWWQQGRKGRVIDYCLRDVWLEGKMAWHILEDGVVRRAPDQLHVRPTIPLDIKNIWHKASKLRAPPPLMHVSV